MQPDAAEIADNKRIQDSIQAAQAERQDDPELADEKESKSIADTVAADTVSLDSAEENRELENKLGNFAPAGKGSEERYVLENEHVKYSFSSKGGAIKRAEVKNFVTHDSMPLVLMSEENSRMNIHFDHIGKRINTEELYFKGKREGNTMKFTTRGSSGERLTLVYSLGKDARMMGFSVITRNMPSDNMFLDVDLKAPRTEKSAEEQRRYSNIFYRTKSEKVDYLSTFSDEDEEVIEKPLHWFSFKNQFFALTFIQDDSFAPNSKFSFSKAESDDFTKNFSASVPLPPGEDKNMQIFSGSTRYNLLKQYDMDLEDQIDLGWALFAWTNKILVIPVFDFLSSFNIHIGIVILILTLFIKTILFPITYKTYLSSAKQRAIKPEMEEINKKYEGKSKEDQMGKQKEIMSLYQKTGVNPFAGCIPMLIQLPILIAMFRFFPASIDLRQKSFLWADDLSSYDTIFDLPFNIPFYGDHVSGLTLLMAVSVFFTTKYNMQNASMGGGNPQAKQIQAMMLYVMPVMLLVWFNNFSSGLSLYYFTANITTLGQQFVIRRFIIDEDKIRSKIEKNKKKPKKQSKFQQKLEEMQKQQGVKQNRKMRRNNK